MEQMKDGVGFTLNTIEVCNCNMGECNAFLLIVVNGELPPHMATTGMHFSLLFACCTAAALPNNSCMAADAIEGEKRK